MLVYIQVLRFFAAFAVVAFHAWGVAPSGFRLPENLASLVLSGAGHGVDLFFVISGFIIFYATHRSNPGAGEFARRRIERIVPLYFFVTFAVALLGITLPDMFGAPDWYTPRHILKSLAFMSFTDGEMPVAYVGWSLEYEMYFYLAVAVLILVMQNVWRGVVLLFSVLAIIGQLPGVSAAAGVYAFFVDPLILEFVLGVMIGMAFVEGRVRWPIMIAAACAVAAVLVMNPANRVIVFGIPSAGLVATAAFASRRRRHPSRPERALARLGDASYSIYLAQVDSVSLASTLVAGLIQAIPPLLLVLVTSCAVVALGWLLNVLVERPSLKLARSLAAPGPRETAKRAAMTKMAATAFHARRAASAGAIALSPQRGAGSQRPSRSARIADAPDRPRSSAAAGGHRRADIARR